MLCVTAACMRMSVSMISDGTCRLCDGGVNGGPVSNVSHNDDFDDAQLDPDTRHTAACNVVLGCASFSPPSPLLLLCAGGTSYGRV